MFQQNVTNIILCDLSTEYTSHQFMQSLSRIWQTSLSAAFKTTYKLLVLTVTEDIWDCSAPMTLAFWPDPVSPSSVSVLSTWNQLCNQVVTHSCTVCEQRADVQNVHQQGRIQRYRFWGCRKPTCCNLTSTNNQGQKEHRPQQEHWGKHEGQLDVPWLYCNF